jgi:predicted MFS family arabinose efflux permease
MKKSLFLSVTFIQIFILYFCYFTWYSVLSLLPPYLSSIGAGKGYIGFFMNIPSLEILLFVLITGRFSNKINKKKALIGGYILGIISTLLMFVFYTDLIILMALRFLAGISYVFSFSMVANFVFDLFPEEKRAQAIALFGVSAVISTPTGTFLAGLLLNNFHPEYLFILTAFFHTITLIIMVFLKEPVHDYKGKESKTFFAILKRKNLLQLFIIAFISGGVMSVIITFLPNFAGERIGKANLTLFFMPSAFIAVIMRTFLKKIFDKITKLQLITFSLLSLLSSLLVMIFLSKEYQLILTGFIYGFGYSVLHPVLSSSFVESGNEDEKVILNNSYLSVNTFGSITITTGLGFLGDIFGITFIFSAAIAIVTIGAIISIIPEKVFYEIQDIDTEIT